MTTQKLLAAIGLTALVAAGCDGNRQSYSAPPPVPMQVQPAAFTNWSKEEVFAKPETAAPTETESVALSFNDNDNPEAYADLFPPGL